MSVAAVDESIRAKQADPRYQRLMEATRAAARDGYDGVSMRELAETCRLSMTTIYQFCRSKDQLIAEAHLDRMRAFRDHATARTVRGATAQERVRKTMRAIAKALEDDELLTRALMRAMYSLDPEVSAIREETYEPFMRMLDAAIGDAVINHRDEAIRTLGHVFDSAIVAWLAGRHDAAWVYDRLDDAVTVVIREPRS